MNFAYFFLGIGQSEFGSHGKVEIRPMAVGFATDSAAGVVIKVPLDTTHAEQTLSAISAHCLQSARALLPESALQTWADTWGAMSLQRATTPSDAGQQWLNLGEDDPTGG